MFDRLIKSLLVSLPFFYLSFLLSVKLSFAFILNILIFFLFYRFIKKIKAEFIFLGFLFFILIFVFDLVLISIQPHEPVKRYQPDGTALYQPGIYKGSYPGNLVDYSNIHLFKNRYCEFYIDEFGYRNRNIQPTVASVLTIGDSYTFGMVSQDSVWPVLLGEKIGKTVYNLGVTNYHPEQAVQTLKNFYQQFPQNKVDWVILMLYQGNDLNDLSIDYWKKFYQENQNWFKRMRNYLGARKNRSIIRNYIRRFFVKNFKSTTLRQDPDGSYTLFYNPEIKEMETSIEDIENNPNTLRLKQSITEFKSLSEKFQFTPLIVFAPSKPSIINSQFAQMQSSFIEYFSEFAKQNKILFINPTTEIKKSNHLKDLYLRDDNHWSGHGNNRVAQIIAFLIKNKL